MRKYIVEREDYLEIDVNAPIAELASSELVRTEAKALSDAANFELRRVGRNMDTVLANSLRPVSCTALLENGRVAELCQMSGGKICPSSCWGSCSMFGGVRDVQPACTAACPLCVDLARVLLQLRAGKLIEASRTLLSRNPMPSVTAKICGGDCAKACAKAFSNEVVKKREVDIRGVEDILGRYIMAHIDIFYARPSGRSGKRVALMGGGFKALSAAFYLRRMGIEVHVFDMESLRESVSFDVGCELDRYIDALVEMGVYFLKSKRVEDNYDKVLFENDHNNRNGTISSVDILTEIDMGRDEAIKVNLNFGLKSYLHEESPFQTFARDALDSPRGSVSECSEAPSERETLVATAPAACACINCACHGANGSLIAAALLALESGLQTNKRSIRAMDFYGTLRPRGLLKDDERVEMIRVPKCGGYTCGCVTIEGMPEIADGVTPLALVYAFALMKGRFFDARIVVAGAAAVPVRQIEIERGLRGKPATREAVQELGRELFGDSANALKIVDIMKGWFAE